MMSSVAELLAAADKGRRDCQVVGRAYYLCSESLSRQNKLLGIPAAIFSAIVGTTIFSTLQTESYFVLKIVTGLIAISAVILTALQTFLNPLKESERHRTAGGKFLTMKREYELYSLHYRGADANMAHEAFAHFEKLARAQNGLHDESPTIPDKFWDRARKEYGWPPTTKGRVPAP